jgi:hypothetical protein
MQEPVEVAVFGQVISIGALLLKTEFPMHSVVRSSSHPILSTAALDE